MLRADYTRKIGGALRLAEQFRQVLILGMSVPKLPDRSIKDHILSPTKDYQSYLLYFFVKYCEPKLVAELSLSIPYYINRQAVDYYHLWCSLREFPTEKIISMCKENHYDEYFLEFLSRVKNLPEVLLYKKPSK